MMRDDQVFNLMILHVTRTDQRVSSRLPRWGFQGNRLKIRQKKKNKKEDSYSKPNLPWTLIGKELKSNEEDGEHDEVYCT